MHPFSFMVTSPTRTYLCVPVVTPLMVATMPLPFNLTITETRKRGRNPDFSFSSNKTNTELDAGINKHFSGFQ